MELTSGLVFENTWKMMFHCHLMEKYRRNLLFTTNHKRLSKEFNLFNLPIKLNPVYKLKTCAT